MDRPGMKTENSVNNDEIDLRKVLGNPKIQKGMNLLGFVGVWVLIGIILTHWQEFTNPVPYVRFADGTRIEGNCTWIYNEYNKAQNNYQDIYMNESMWEKERTRIYSQADINGQRPGELFSCNTTLDCPNTCPECPTIKCEYPVAQVCNCPTCPICQNRTIPNQVVLDCINKGRPENDNAAWQDGYYTKRKEDQVCAGGTPSKYKEAPTYRMMNCEITEDNTMFKIRKQYNGDQMGFWLNRTLDEQGRIMWAWNQESCLGSALWVYQP